MSGVKQINCAYCGKKKLSKDDIGLNKKFIDHQIERMMCLTCMAEYLETTKEDLNELIERFKREGCALFR